MTSTYDQKHVFSNIVVSCLGSVYFGYALSVFNPISEFIQTNVFPDLPSGVITLMTSLTPVGAGIGAFLAGNLLNKIGRKASILLADVLAIISTLMTIIESPGVILIARFLTGFCVGLNSSIVPLYNDEMAPVEAKGITSTFTQLFICTGVLIAFLLGLGTPTGTSNPESQWWKFIILGSIVLNVVRSYSILKYFNYDTPQYLVTRNKDEEAKAVLLKMYGNEERANTELLLIRSKKRAEQSGGSLTYKQLLDAPYKDKLIIGCGLSILQQLSGINAITFYSTDIFRQGVTDPTDSTPLFYTMAVGVINVLAALATIPVLKAFQKRTALIIGDAACMVCLMAIAYLSLGDPSPYTKWYVFGFVFFFGFSLGSVTWIMVGQILPDLGVGVAVLMNWVFTVIIAQMFPTMISVLGMSGSFFIFSLFCAGGLGFITKYIPESNQAPIQITSAHEEVELGYKDLGKALLLEDLQETDLTETNEITEKIRGSQKGSKRLSGKKN